MTTARDKAPTLAEDFEALVAVIEGPYNVDSLTEYAVALDEFRGAIKAAEARVVQLQQERDQLAEFVERLIDAGIEQWHTVVNDEPALHSWLGLTWDEYKAWVEGGVAALAASRRAGE